MRLGDYILCASMTLNVLAMAAAPDYDDFTDSGLGCVDCLDPAEPIPMEP